MTSDEANMRKIIFMNETKHSITKTTFKKKRIEVCVGLRVA